MAAGAGSRWTGGSQQDGARREGGTADGMNAIICAVDDLTGLDRLDWWLNEQRGSRLLLLLWLDAYPLGFLLCDALWACWAFKGDFGQAFLGAGAVAALVAVPMVFVLSGLHALRIRQMRRNPGKAWPRLSWRGFVSRLVYASVLVSAFVTFADNQYGKPNPGLLTARWFQAVICIGYFGLLFAENHYARQVGKRRMSAQAHAPAGNCPSW